MMVGLFVLILTSILMGIVAYGQSILIYSKNTSEMIAGIVAIITLGVGVSLFFSLKKIMDEMGW